MEPVHGGRDDPAVRRWSPSRMPPQWSPSTEDGTTGGRRRRPDDRRARAAMEPVHGGRDDVSAKREHHRRRLRPQWSPSTEDGTTATAPWTWATGDKPQWSPSTEDGTTADDDGFPAASGSAAMEPVHGGRDDTIVTTLRKRGSVPQWSPSTEDGTTSPGTCRFRMPAVPQWSPSTEDGTTSPADDHARPRSRRNGARPRRTGRPGRPRDLAAGVADAAMEPVHGGRDDPMCRQTSSTRAPPQWSPSTEDGTTDLGCVAIWGRFPPQWSPSTEDGTTR